MPFDEGVPHNQSGLIRKLIVTWPMNLWSW